MQTESVFVGARLVDSEPYSEGGTEAQANALAASGVEGFIGYLGAMNATRLGYILNAGLGFMPVTFADAFDGNIAVARAQALGLTPGCTVWLDIEGKKLLDLPFEQVRASCINWCTPVAAAGFGLGLYVGSPQPFTGDELGALPFNRYWCAPSRVIDRTGHIWDCPTNHGQPIGFCMRQQWPQGNWKDTGVFVDVNIVGQDYKARTPSWVRA